MSQQTYASGLGGKHLGCGIRESVTTIQHHCYAQMHRDGCVIPIKFYLAGSCIWPGGHGLSFMLNE